MKKRLFVYEKRDKQRKVKCNYQQTSSQKIQRLLRRKFNKQISIIREANNKVFRGERKMARKKIRTTEVLSYRFILNELEALGWDIRNPLSSSNGQVYTQRQCLDDPRIKEQLEEMHPENIIKLSEEEIYTIEAKRDRDMIDTALKEAQEDYADKINKSKKIQSVIISGVGASIVCVATGVGVNTTGARVASGLTTNQALFTPCPLVFPRFVSLTK